jgi:2-methylcitrate dehydratase PrpD
MNAGNPSRAITAGIAAYAVGSRFDALPEQVRQETVRAFLNWLGCTLGGSREEASVRAAAAIAMVPMGAQARLIGHARRADMGGAAFINCLSSSALAFDDTHLATVTHPTGPVAASLLAYAETTPVSGAEFLNALALGIEIQCRMSNVLLMPPAMPNLSLYITGITGPIGAAVALGRLMGFDERRLRWTIGLAATQAAGIRATHGSMAGIVVPAFGARAGVFAAQLAASGIDCSEDALEAPRGFVDIFTSGADLGHAVEGLGTRFELLANAYKPYPAGIVIHAAIDACLEIVKQLPAGAEMGSARLSVNPLTLALTDRRHPATPFEAQISLYHWAAHVFLRREAGTAALHPAEVADPAIAALRDRITATGDDTLARDEAVAEMLLTDGTRMRAHVPHARGGVSRPMTDAELEAKFLTQALGVMPQDATAALLTALRVIPETTDIDGAIGNLLDAAGCNAGEA